MIDLRPFAALFLVAALLSPAVQAQSVIRGQVLDAETGEPLPGVHVLAEGTTVGTTTDREGRFELATRVPLRTLVVSYLGYQTRAVALAGEPGPLVVALVPRLLDLQPIIVSASREEERRTEAPVAVAVLSANELATKKPGALHEVLSAVPGVHMTDLGNEQHTMSIRQPLSYKALYAYLEDGIPLRPTGLFNHNALIEVNMAGVERIEVLRGPSSSLYGANAIGGAVNFITPRPSPGPAGSMSLRTDHYGYRRGDAAVSSTFGKLGLWAGGYGARQRGGWTEHSDFDKRSVSVRADYAFAPTTRLVTTLTTNHLDTDTNGSLDSLRFYDAERTSLQTFTYRRVDATRLTSRLAHVWDGRHSTDVAVYWRRNAVGQLPHYRIRDDRARPTAAWGEVNEDRFWSLGLTVQHHTYFDRMRARLIAGAGLERSPAAYEAHYLDITREAATGRYTAFSRRDSLLTDYDVDLVNAAAYAQFELAPVRPLKLVASLRYDRITYGYDNHLPPSAFSGAPDATDRFSRLSPRVGFTVDLGGERGVYGNYSQGFLPPEVSELYRGVKVPTLQPARFDSYEAGGWAALLAGTLYAEASLYRMDGTNEIIAVRLDDGATENRNAGRTRHTGVEYGLTYMPVRALHLRLTGTNARHTFVRHEDQGRRLDGHAMDAAPAWTAHAEVLYRPPFLPGARAGAEWEHVGSYFMDPQNTMRYGGYDLVNLRLGYTVRGLEVWMHLRNVTDARYATIAAKSRFGQQYHPGAPRSISLGVGYRFGNH